MVRSDRRRDDGKRPKGPMKRSQADDSWPASQKVRKGARPAVDENSEVVKTFRVFQSELDAKHDKHERLVKLSRDVTIESKRTIFLLHRITSEEVKQPLIREAQAKIEAIQSGLLLRIAQELEGEDPFLFQRAVSPGLQEYVEAVLFLGYAAEARLMGLGEVRGQLRFRVPATDGEDSKSKDSSDPTVEGVLPESVDQENLPRTPPMRTLALHLSPTDYVLGMADFTGELMRACINGIGAGDAQTPFALVAFLRQLYDGCRFLGNRPGREFVRKLAVMRQSLAKVESACYMLQVRGSEIPKHMLLDVISSLPNSELGMEDFDT
ncbi:translin-associated protein X-like [Acanthaster planci]|uniref:Translin-associated protein X-like n=1 Tax=Acanthaster planci TaxID=133434 RepID=A0A8B7Z1I2_ACAPL|nr:translin-associated protein X-like [Acanthaster planci]